MNFLKQKTNFDAIKEMTIDELAQFLTDVECGDGLCADRELVRSQYKAWLESVVNENNG